MSITGLFSLLCFLAGLVWPTYASFKALVSQGAKDDTQWLTYWVVYSSLTAFETVAQPVIVWIPLYSLIKLFLLLWLALPQTKGAAWVFEHFLLPFMHEHVSKYDPSFKNAGNVLDNVRALLQATMGRNEVMARAEASRVSHQHGPPGFPAPKVTEGYAD